MFKAKYCFPWILSLALIGCVNVSQIDTKLQEKATPDAWQNTSNYLKIEDDWLVQFKQAHLTNLVEEALVANQTLRQQAFQVEILEQQQIKSHASFWPDLDFTISSNRNHAATTDTTSSRHTAKLESSYEIDLWGKLSDSQKSTQLAWLTAKSQYQQQKQTLVANVTNTWFSLITARQLVKLSEQRVENAKQSLDIIESGYKQGVNKALDVYLSRNDLNTEVSNLASQKNNLIETARQLERLLGRYPSGKLTTLVSELSLPELPAAIPLGMPSDIISRKPQLQAAWNQVLAQDANLAFAHKSRFPSVKLTASVSNTTTEISDLLSSSAIGWSLLGNLTAPIFKAGELKADEEIARLRLKQQEQAYLTTLYQAFNQVESAITNEASLTTRYTATLAAEKNALAAQTIAFEQYQRGLVSYTTVLNAQDRAFSAQSGLIQIKNQLLSNRVNFHLALGGDFEPSDANQQEISPNE